MVCNPKVKRIRDKKYLNYLHNKSCNVCYSTIGSCGHHLKYGNNAGVGIKIPDNFCIILCYRCHIEDLHRRGEKQFLNKNKFIFGYDPIAYANNLYQKYLDETK